MALLTAANSERIKKAINGGRLKCVPLIWVVGPTQNKKPSTRKIRPEVLASLSIPLWEAVLQGIITDADYLP